MNLDKNARLAPLGRERIVRSVMNGHAPEGAASAVGVCPRTVRKWVARFTAERVDACKICPPERVGSTVPHLGLKRSAALEPAQTARYYERQQSGKLVHHENKKLGRCDRISHPVIGERKGQSNSRGVGWELAHFCIDDAARVSFTN